jgi:crossover junction endodeoxyribonuclease RuvC
MMTARRLRRGAEGEPGMARTLAAAAGLSIVTLWNGPNNHKSAGLGRQSRSPYARTGGGAINGAMAAQAIRILGIDPGLRRTGWGLIEAEGNRLIYVACGSVETSERDTLGERLVAIHDGLIAVIEKHAPHEAAVEHTFVNTNAAATLKLGQARGIAMLVPAKAGLSVAEYAPNLVKKTIVGAGHSEKAQIRMMIGVLLPKADPQSEDAADALAIAVCHAHHRTSILLKVAAS